MTNINTTKIDKKILNRRTWKKKAPDMSKVDIKDPESYIWLYKRLEWNLVKLNLNTKNIISKKYNYIEIEFFVDPNNLKDYFYSLKNQWINFIKIHNNTNKVFFYISDYEKLLSYIKMNLLNLKEYTEKKISSTDFWNKQIILWKSFYINTENTKWEILHYVHKFKKIKVNYLIDDQMEEWVKSNIKELSTTYSKINIDVIWWTIEISELKSWGYLEARAFLKELSTNDNILSITLDSFFSTVHWPEWIKNEILLNIAEPTSELPIVAVIDSGIKRNLLTSSCLLDEWLDYTNTWDPFKDETWHWTMVANEIIYWDEIFNYFIMWKSENEPLYPRVKVFSVKVLEKHNWTIYYEKIFDENWDFLKAIKKHNIKIINISLNETTPKAFWERWISKNASILDKFAMKHNVLFVVCTWNIEEDEFIELTNKYPKLDFHKNNFIWSDELEDKYINISSPWDLISWITVWWWHHHEWACHMNQYKCFSTSLLSRGYNWPKNFKKPDILSLWSWDYLIYKDKKWNIQFDFSHTHKTTHIWIDETKIILSTWTSFSAPRVSRALAMWVFKYPEYNIETVKWLFLHNINFSSKHQNYIFNLDDGKYEKWEIIDMPKYLWWMWLHTWNNEDLIFSDNENKITFILEWKVKSKELIQFSIPIVKLIWNWSTLKKNKLQLKLSVTMMPSNKVTKNRDITFDEANEFFLSWSIHKNNFDILDSKNRCIAKWTWVEKKKEILLNWTSHYFGTYNKTFSETSEKIIKDNLLEVLWEDDTMTLSIRWFNKKNNTEEKSFSAIFSIEDLWETNEVRNKINIDLTI